MHLITALAAGVKGAENGSAKVYKRGTSTPVTWYEDFEGTVPRSEYPIALDANGGAEVYIDEVADVRVYAADTTGGAEVRNFTAAYGDNAVEVRSASFTGTDYVDGSSAANKPVMLGSALDTIATSFGAEDFKVLINGTKYLIKNAFLSTWGMLYNVKDPAYGATGDGTTDDSSAIDAAIAAAAADGGGVVFFPPGNYRITSQINGNVRVSLWGSGVHATRITMDSASATFYNVASLLVGGVTIQDMQFAAAQTNSGVVFNLNVSARVVIQRVRVVDDNIQGDIINCGVNSTELSVVDCELSKAAGAHVYDGSLATGMNTARFESCRFRSGVSSSSASYLNGSGMRVTGCELVNTTFTSGTFSNVEVQPGGHTFIQDCKFSESAGATVTAIEISDLNADDRFYEDNNFFDWFDAVAANQIIPYNISASTDEQQVYLGTREMTSVTAASASGGTIPIDSDQFGRVVLQCNSTDARTLSLGSDIPVQSRFTLVLWNDGAGGNITFTHDSTNSETSASTIVVANDTMQAVEFVAFAGDGGTVRWHQINTPIAVSIP